MNNTKPTPGPWGLMAGRANGPNGATIICRGLAIARMSVKADIPIDEKWANARLIAAAPELLEMVTRMRQGYRNLMEFDLVSASTKNSLEVYIAEADRLLAKAEGPPTPDRGTGPNTPEAK